MKKSVVALLSALFGIVLGICCLLVILNISPSARDNFIVGSEAEEVTEKSVSSVLTEKSLEIAECMKNGDFNALAEYVHKDYGVYVSPGATVVLSSNKLFKANDVAKFGSEKATYVWGIESDLGSPIEMTAKDFFADYLFDADYTEPTLIGINTVVKSGNALDNVVSAFPDGKFVDLYFNGTKEMEFGDWSILRLVFEECEGEYMLVAIIHSDAAL